MVAYSFKARFADPIIAGTKRQTIRADRKRHARPGEALQLYCGMRTKHCHKIIPDPVCVAVHHVLIVLPRRRHPPSIMVHDLAGGLVEGCTWGVSLDGFARRDGFADFEEMVAFWRENHPGVHGFRGVLITWRPQANG